MQVAIFGLGKMGAQIARRLKNSGFDVLAWNRSEGPRLEAAKAGIKPFAEVDEIIAHIKERPRVFWLMLPNDTTGEFLEQKLGPHLEMGDIVIDGGNSFYKDSIRRSGELKSRGIVFYDCGTSGGVWGEQNGFALMVGGSKEHWEVVKPIFQSLSGGSNYGLVGNSGAGHFVKMVHNGIEYGMMEAIAEGYGVLEASNFNLDLNQVTKIYQEGTVIRSWLIDLLSNIFEKDGVQSTSGEIAATGEGQWTVEAGKELGVDVRVIEDALNVRKESAEPKNQQKFSNKIVALLRKQFGGHSVNQKK